MEMQVENIIMNINFSCRSAYLMARKTNLLCLTLLCIVSHTAWAEPYLAIKNNLKCGVCHVNPLGGGMRTAFGNIYGISQLPVDVSDFSAADMGKINDFIGVGANIRYNAEHSSDDADNTSSTFRIDSAQVYVSITPKNTGLSFYLDQQVAPGAAVNREAYIQYNFADTHYIKAGKMFVPFGLRLEDDTAFVRQVTGFNFDSSDNGAELGLNYGQTTVNLFVTNGTSSVSNNDDKFLYGFRVERLFSNFRLGGGAVLNDRATDKQQIYNLYGGMNWQDISLLAEVDRINTEQQGNDDLVQQVALIELNYQWQKGLNLKFTAEYYDPNTDIDENHETRFSLVAEYTPLSNVQLRLGFRSSEGIPQQPQRSVDKLFLQSHLYF
jgi:hypothetical protein